MIIANDELKVSRYMLTTYFVYEAASTRAVLAKMLTSKMIDTSMHQISEFRVFFCCMLVAH
jgi:hypothetical protein